MLVGKKIETPYEELTYQIIGCAMAVHRAHGPGLWEDSYQRGLEAHLEKKSLDFEAQPGVDRILPPKDVSEHQVNRQRLWVPDWLREEE